MMRFEWHAICPLFLEWFSAVIPRAPETGVGRTNQSQEFKVNEQPSWKSQHHPPSVLGRNALHSRAYTRCAWAAFLA